MTPTIIFRPRKGPLPSRVLSLVFKEFVSSIFIFYSAFLLEIATFIAALVFTYADIIQQRKNPDRFKKLEKPAATLPSEKAQAPISENRPVESKKDAVKTPEAVRRAESRESDLASETKTPDEKAKSDRAVSEKSEESPKTTSKAEVPAVKSTGSSWLTNRNQVDI